MKYRYFIFCLLLLPILGKGQGFESVFGTTYNDSGIKAVEIPGEDAYLVISNVVDTFSLYNYGLNFTKIDLAGNKVWEKLDTSIKYTYGQTLSINSAGVHYSIIESTGPFDTIILKQYGYEGELISDLEYLDPLGYDCRQTKFLEDGSLIAFGKNPFDEKKIIVQKISPDGDLIWRKEHFNNEFSNQNISDFKVNPDGSFLAIYRAIVGGYGFLIKFDPSGNLTWMTNIPYTVIQSVNVVAYPDNDAYLLYTENNLTPAHIVKIDSSGQFIWDKYFNEHATFIKGVLPGEDNSLYMTGNFFENNIYLQFLLRLDNEGEVIWEKRYHEFSATIIQAGQLFRDVNGDFIIASDYIPADPSHLDPTIYKTDSNGELLWYWRSTNDFYLQKTDAVPISNGNYLILGYTNGVNPSSYDNYLAKVSSDGLVYTKLITGQLLYDENESCSYDNGEPPLAGWVVKAIGNQTTYALTHADGSFLMPASSDTVLVTALPPNNCWTTCTDPLIATFDTTFDTVSVVIKGQATKDCPILEVDIATPLLRRCFSNNQYYLQCRNTGTVSAENVQLTVMLDSFFVFQDASLPLTAQNGNELVFTIDSININESIGFTIQVQVSCDALLGQVHCVSFSAHSDNECTNPAPSNPYWTIKECQPNVGSYDPNDKRAFSQGISTERYIPADSLIEYQVRFQNTGTDTAFNVVVYDHLDSLLDIESIRAGASSHPYRMELEGDNTVKFVFENIQLPDSMLNEVASHGFIKFRIRHRPGVLLGDVIPNKAAIYFDFNEAVITNKLELEIGSEPPTAQTLLVQPFLQDAEPTSIVIVWEASDATAGLVEWGLNTSLGSSTASQSEIGLADTRIHHAHITGLLPDTRYYYRVSVGTAQSGIFNFITPPLKNAEKSFALVAMSDMQQDASNPTIFEEMCNDGVIAYLNGDIPEKLAFAMLPGDLVDNGPDYGSWKTTFFDPSQNLFRQVPVYPAIGNHEANTPTYFKYFELPANGTPGYEEHWWYKDYSNLRIIGLNSNSGYTIQAQLDWLETVLAEAAADPDIDFVFAQLHHPHHSELWPAGNLDYTGEVIKKLEAFTATSGKPSLHFYGHTHAYSRGQSQDYVHSMVNVATSGGNIDYWGEFPQTDYPEHVVSQDEYGFVWVDVQAGDAPQFSVKRISRGNENQHLDNVLRDSFLIKRYNQPPAKPVGTFPTEGMVVSPDCVLELAANAYADPDGDLQSAAQWQVSADPGFATTAVDSWRQYENWYNNVDLQAGDDLTNENVEGLEENTTYYWRVRYRDRSLGWSEWSEPIGFQTIEGNTTDNLLVNGGAEDGLTAWTTVAGVVESILSGDCAGNLAYAGDRLFAVGGVCTESAYGEARQDVDVSGFAPQIAEGNLKVKFGGYLSDYQGSDRPDFRLDFLDASGDSLSSTPTYGINSGDWFQFRETAEVPTDCAQIRFVLMGTREAGTDNDSYFDEMFLKLDTAGCIPLELPIAAFSATPISGCINLTVQFTDQSLGGASSWEWSFPGGIPNASTEQNPTVQYYSEGNYDVTLTTANAVGTATITQSNYIVVNEPPIADFTVTVNNNVAIFTNLTVDAMDYYWYFGDGSPPNSEFSPTHTYSTGGVYLPELVVYNECGGTNLSVEITVGESSTADIPGIRRFEVFPNPNDGRFTLIMEGAPQTDLLGLSFGNALGQRLYQGIADFRTGYLTKEFSFGELAKGVYILQVKSGDRVMVRRLVVE